MRTRQREDCLQAVTSRNVVSRDNNTTSPLFVQESDAGPEAMERARRYEDAARRAAAAGRLEPGVMGFQRLALANHYTTRSRGLWLIAGGMA